MIPDLNQPSAVLRGFFADPKPSHIAVAVSGGSDSLALLSLFQDWRAEGGPELSAVTVNHGLRPEAADEADAVAALCHTWNIPHQILTWSRENCTGNIHDQARRARYALMSKWASALNIPVIALGHTQDDQAETFLMRLSRGAGVDGLSAMRAKWRQDDVAFVRPLLACKRDTLRDHLHAKNLAWVEDAANSDPAYLRSRVRAALPALGVSVETLADVASHMTQARDALYAATIQSARNMVTIEFGDVVITRGGYKSLHSDLARRLLLTAINWINGADYPPRGAALAQLQRDILKRRNATLQGCDVSHTEDHIRITREAGAVVHISAAPGELWDGRWRVFGPDVRDARVSRLGQEGLRFCPDRALSSLPARSLVASPAVWQGDELIAAPLANLENGWSATLVPRTCNDFAAQILH